VDREKIAAQGLTIESIARTIHSAVNGTIATGYREGDHEIGVRLRLREEDRNSLDTVRRLLVPVGDGKQMEVGTFIRPQEGTGHSAVLRENQKRVEQIRVEYEKSERKTVFAELERAISNTRASYAKEPDENRPQLRLREDNEETSESLAGLVYAFAISAVLIYMLLAGQFESLIHPITLCSDLVASHISLGGCRSPFALPLQ
jgi:HAE1 family hydrophobic/amphiphilic exporter-1